MRRPPIPCQTTAGTHPYLRFDEGNPGMFFRVDGIYFGLGQESLTLPASHVIDAAILFRCLPSNRVTLIRCRPGTVSSHTYTADWLSLRMRVLTRALAVLTVALRRRGADWEREKERRRRNQVPLMVKWQYSLGLQCRPCLRAPSSLGKCYAEPNFARKKIPEPVRCKTSSAPSLRWKSCCHSIRRIAIWQRRCERPYSC